MPLDISAVFTIFVILAAVDAAGVDDDDGYEDGDADAETGDHDADNIPLDKKTGIITFNLQVVLHYG